MAVKLYEPNTTLDSRMRDLFFKSIEQASTEASVRNIQTPKFYFFGDSNCIAFYQSRLFTPVLVIAGRDTKKVNATMNKIQGTADNLYVGDETLDHGVSTSRGRKPLAQRDLPKPEWEPAEQGGLDKLEEFMEALVVGTHDERAAYNLACKIEKGYFPMRVKEEKKPPKKKAKKKSKK